MGHVIGYPEFPNLVAQFVYQQRHPDADVPDNCPPIVERGYTYNSALATFYAPSNQSGVGGMHRLRIHACQSWKKGPPRYDCVFAEHNSMLPGFKGLYVVQVVLFFSFSYRNTFYPCALVRWFTTIGTEPCKKTNMWMVEPELDENGQHLVSVIHLDCIMRPAHLIGVYGDDVLPRNFKHTDSLSAFAAFYVNKFSDYHAFELAF